MVGNPAYYQLSDLATIVTDTMERLSTKGILPKRCPCGFFEFRTGKNT